MTERTTVNPWEWSVAFGFNQGELVEGGNKVLFCAGQTSVDAEGSPQHVGDMAAQLALSVDNLEAVLAGAGMTLANVVRLNVYTTDIDSFLEHSGVLVERGTPAGLSQVTTLLGVARLAFTELLVELEATAVA
jgi:enamine deaminase RidA (YjgF/YER057c/UK114 family)